MCFSYILATTVQAGGGGKAGTNYGGPVVRKGARTPSVPYAFAFLVVIPI